MRTIIALATPPQNCAIHIVRISGQQTFEITNKVCLPKIKKISKKFQYTKIFDNKQLVDKVLINTFCAPKSYTGEDIIEINCHGSYFIANKIINLFLKHGCVLAEPGEFTKLAVLNNKMDLVHAMSINELINTTNDYSLNINNAINNNQNKLLIICKDKILQITSSLEINIDFPELDKTHKKNTKKNISAINWLISTFTKIINECKKVINITHGINIAIIGQTNVGKSSLLNAILKNERAIISKIPGTTRDIIKESVNINGLTYNFLDTAGFRNTKNQIEIIGIEKTRNVINEAHLIILVIDGSSVNNKEDEEIINMINNKKHLIVINKSDLKIKNKIKGIKISAKNGELNNLLQQIDNQFKKTSTNNQFLLTNSSQVIPIFEGILKQLKEIKIDLISKAYPDVIALKVTSVLDKILDLLNEKKDFDLINHMFKNFCLGK